MLTGMDPKSSEPTAQALTAVLHELSTHPEHQTLLFDEIGETSITDDSALAGLKHLNAVLQEAMRLHPSLITGGLRKTREKGVQIGDVFIPPHTTVVTPLYTISKREYGTTPIAILSRIEKVSLTTFFPFTFRPRRGLFRARNRVRA